MRTGVYDVDRAIWVSRLRARRHTPVYEVKYLNDSGDLVTVKNPYSFRKPEAQKIANRYGAAAIYCNGLPIERLVRIKPI